MLILKDLRLYSDALFGRLVSVTASECYSDLMAWRGPHPDAYDPGFCGLLIDYFENAASAPERKLPTTVTVEKGHDYKGNKGSVKREARRICAELPTFEGFASSIGFSVQTCWGWRASHPEWAEACSRAKDIQKRILIDRGLNRQYDPSAFQFVAMNITDMRPAALIDMGVLGAGSRVTVTIETVGAPAVEAPGPRTYNAPAEPE